GELPTPACGTDLARVCRTGVVTELRPPQALVVDDFDGTRDAVCLMLDLLGYDAEGVASGIEALEQLETASYTVVGSDGVESGVSGWVVAVHVRQCRPGMAVVLMTRQLTQAMAYRARHWGLSVLEKPFSLTALQTATEEARRGGSSALVG